MKKILENGVSEKITKKNTLMWVMENQHPVMYWWFAITSISFCSMYAILLTTFS